MPISLVAVGDFHSLFECEGRVFRAGSTLLDAGLGEVDASINQKILACTPRKVSFIVQCEDGTDAASQVIGAVHAGAAASFAISSSGNVFAWGSTVMVHSVSGTIVMSLCQQSVHSMK